MADAKKGEKVVKDQEKDRGADVDADAFYHVSLLRSTRYGGVSYNPGDGPLTVQGSLLKAIMADVDSFELAEHQDGRAPSHGMQDAKEEAARLEASAQNAAKPEGEDGGGA